VRSSFKIQADETLPGAGVVDHMGLFEAMLGEPHWASRPSINKVDF